MDQPKLVKLTVDNFKKFSHVELELDNFTSINGKTQPEGQYGNFYCFVLIFNEIYFCSALGDLVDSLKFVFNNFDFDINEISFNRQNDDT